MQLYGVHRQYIQTIYLIQIFLCFRILNRGWMVNVLRFQVGLLHHVPIIKCLYWKENTKLVHYYLFHMFFQMVIEAYPDEWNKVVPFSNATPHILLLRLFEEYDETIANAVKEMTSFHKLTYKFEESDTTIKNTFYQVLFGEQE